ncbi:hypothetical protein F2Q68_00032261 [Brassica cretica]|uniref:Uncharacterized protein n=1 Tax=Brassica cretica TaxID=69181 RepID=A0A8S9GDF6_BRACR|nr:hypothetical protein F2Q68_00032261 [Brassica cretica]
MMKWNLCTTYDRPHPEENAATEEFEHPEEHANSEEANVEEEPEKGEDPENGEETEKGEETARVMAGGRRQTPDGRRQHKPTGQRHLTLNRSAMWQYGIAKTRNGER